MTIEEFRAADLRIGRIDVAEIVAGSEKLVRLEIDLGGERRQIVAGVGKSYKPSELVGRNVAVVANLEPRNIMGQASQGMILAANGDGGEPVILIAERAVPPGAKIT